MKKRFLMMMLAGVLAFSMIGCGGGEAEQEDPNTGDEIVDVEGDVEGEAGDAEGEADGEQEGEAGQEEQEEPEVQKPIEQKPEVQDPVVDEPEVGGEEENTGDVEGGVVIDKAFADMTLEEMILASYANIELPFTGEMEIDKTDADAVAFYLGTNDVTFKRGVVSEAMISSIAHSVVVLEMEDAAAAEAAAATLKETAPVGKWVCVVPDQVGTAHRGNIVMMAMSNSADAILANFNALQ
ncbi:MAG: hypothetical protein II983_03135 [Firmicutes bacterium]|nr:hypothetical protein [Bacillota bacterium]MBQ6684747.1 hypothetical protein [Bacillota bacterium]